MLTRYVYTNRRGISFVGWLITSATGSETFVCATTGHELVITE